MTTLAVYNLRKHYKSRIVVKDVSFDVQGGEVVGLLGPNGAGKTTCFYMIVGLVASDGGEIRLKSGEAGADNDANLTHMPIHKRARLGVSYLPQENSVFRKLTVAENVRAVLELQDGLDEDAIEKRLDELLEELHVSPPARQQRHFAVGWRAPPRRNRPRAGHQPALHPARRTVCRRRSDRRASTSRRSSVS